MGRAFLTLIWHPLIRVGLLLLCVTVLPFSIDDGLRDWGLVSPMALTPADLERWVAVRFWCVALPLRIVTILWAAAVIECVMRGSQWGPEKTIISYQESLRRGHTHTDNRADAQTGTG